jgi:hypothetical protein
MPGATGSATRRSAARAEMLARLGTPHIFETLPATVELQPAAALDSPTRILLGGAAVAFAALLYTAWVGGYLEGIEGEPLSDYLGHLAGLAWNAWMLLPAALLAAAVVLQLMRRRRPAWVRISLSREQVRVEGPAGTWTTPIKAFRAVALRRRAGYALRLTNHTTNVNRRIYAGRSYAVLERPALWWVELVHDDSDRSVPIWAQFGEAARAGAERAARGFAHRLDLPVET